MVPKSYVPIYDFFIFHTSSRAKSEAPESSVNTNPAFPKVKGTNELAKRTVESTAVRVSSYLFHYYKGASLYQTKPNKAQFHG